MSEKSVWAFRITASHLLENLANALYGDPADSLMELVRNGAVACMNGNWNPKVAKVEVTIGKHKLAPGSKALVILDHGSGFTDPCIKRFCQIGAALTDKDDRKLHGAAQKRIGRFAAFSLNQNCVGGDPNSGFYILTRTEPQGPVKFVNMIPALIERDQGVSPRLIDAESTEMDSLKGISGSFSAIVIPDPVFKTPNEIRKALEWRVPRRQDQMFELCVDGKSIHPPQLSSRVCCSQKDGGVDVFLDKAPEGEDAGIWFSDQATGFRVAFAPQIGPAHLPPPFWRRDLVGDIFVRDALANQDTGRSRLNPRFLKGKTWRDAMLFLAGNVTGDVRALLGDSDVFGNSKVKTDLLGFVDLCRGVYGDPDGVADGPEFLFKKTPPNPSGNDSKKTPAIPRDDDGDGKGEVKRKVVRTIPFRLGKRTFFFSNRALDQDVMAQVDPTGRVIYFNEGYGAMPKAQGARQEHVILQVLGAIGSYDYPSDTSSAMLFVSSTRRELLGR